MHVGVTSYTAYGNRMPALVPLRRSDPGRIHLPSREDVATQSQHNDCEKHNGLNHSPSPHLFRVSTIQASTAKHLAVTIPSDQLEQQSSYSFVLRVDTVLGGSSEATVEVYKSSAALLSSKVCSERQVSPVHDSQGRLFRRALSDREQPV